MKITEATKNPLWKAEWKGKTLYLFCERWYDARNVLRRLLETGGRDIEIDMVHSGNGSAIFDTDPRPIEEVLGELVSYDEIYEAHWEGTAVRSNCDLKLVVNNVEPSC